MGQVGLPLFLEGTWKRTDKDHYEHWDKMSARLLKGFSYSMIDGERHITEYATINQRKNNDIVYSVVLKNQNNGKTIHFKQIPSDTALIYENENHDFPKKIVYKRINDQELRVYLSDGGSKTYSYKLLKLHDKQTQIEAPNATVGKNPIYNAALAKRLGADAYGMKSYQLIILKTGSSTINDTAIINTAFRGHMANIKRMVNEGKLIVAGPLGKNELNYRGLFIFNTANKEETESLLKKDPAIQANLLSYEILNWYGSAALPLYLEEADKIWTEQP